MSQPSALFSKRPVAAANFDNRDAGDAKSKTTGGVSPKTSVRDKSTYEDSKKGSVTKINSGKTLPSGKMKNPLDGLKLPQIHRSPDWDPDMEEKNKTIYDRSVDSKKKQDFPTCNPQRVALPGYLNTPARRSIGDDGTGWISEKEGLVLQKQVQDLEMLATACSRGNRTREEGRTLFSLGILEDNLGNYSKALKHYYAFLKVCMECNDLQGCALAFHCLGVCHQLLGTYPETKPQSLRRALYFHSKHREHSESAGKFIAHLNMGICYSHLGEKESATVNHQYALKHALERNSPEEQALALGNLGFSNGMYDNDIDKQKNLVERYMQITDKRDAAPLAKLGSLATQEGNFQAGKEYFEEALEVARHTKDSKTEQSARVNLGIAMGETLFADHVKSILGKAVS